MWIVEATRSTSTFDNQHSTIHIHYRPTKKATTRATHFLKRTCSGGNALRAHPVPSGLGGVPSFGHFPTGNAGEVGSVLMHYGYARAWADSFAAGAAPRSRLRFIPVSPGSKKWTFRVSTYTVALESIVNPGAASTRPTT